MASHRPGLAASYRVIKFDNRGAGRSSDPPGPYAVRLMADDALAVLDAADAASAHVYGVSLDGAIALQLALDHPGRVRSLILGCTAASAGGVPRRALLTRVRSLLPAAALNRMAWKLLYGPGTPAVRRAEDQQIVQRTESAGDHWRPANAPHLVALVRATTTFISGELVEQPGGEISRKPPKRS